MSHWGRLIHPVRYPLAVLAQVFVSEEQLFPAAAWDLFAAFPEAPWDSGSVLWIRGSDPGLAVVSDRPGPASAAVAVLPAVFARGQRSLQRRRWMPEPPA